MSEVLPKPPIVLWIKQRDTHVQIIENVFLRVKHASKLGENLRGFKEGGGELSEMNWDNVMGLRPSVLEINNSRNPFSSFVDALKAVDDEKLGQFFARLSLVSLNSCDITSTDFMALLKRLSLLQAFSYSDVSFADSDWKEIANELSRLNVRAMDISSNAVLSYVLPTLNMELLKLSGSPGVSSVDFKNFTGSLVTVKVLVAQDLNFANETDAEEFLEVLTSRFPRLSTLVWDWNMVDPAVSFDDRTKGVLSKLVDIFKQLNLLSIAIMAYTPCNETKYACGEIARQLNTDLPNVQLLKFSSKGLSSGDPNFSLVLAGQDQNAMSSLKDIFVLERNSNPDIRHFLRLLPSSPVISSSTASTIIVDFAGFETDLIKKTYNSKK